MLDIYIIRADTLDNFHKQWRKNTMIFRINEDHFDERLGYPETYISVTVRIQNKSVE